MKNEFEGNIKCVAHEGWIRRRRKRRTLYTNKQIAALMSYLRGKAVLQQQKYAVANERERARGKQEKYKKESDWKQRKF